MLEGVLASTRSAFAADEPFYQVPEQQFAWVAARRHQTAGEGPDRIGGLTVLIGPRGSGKSVLVRQMLREAHRRNRRSRLAMFTAADWPRLLELTSQGPAWQEFCEHCAGLDVIVGEDLDRAAGDPEFSEELSRWLDGLLAHDVRVVMTFSDPPGNCPKFSPRLVSRLHGGLNARIAQPSPATRREFLSWAAKSAHVSLSDDVLAWLADQPPGNLRGLRQSFDRLLVEHRPPTRINDLAAVQRTLSESAAPKLSLAVIAEDVAEEFGVALQELRGKTRNLAYRIPRQCAMLLAHEVGGWPMAEIGKFFGRRTHTSVSYSCRRFQDVLGETPSLREHVQRLRARLSDRRLTDCG